MISSLWNWRNHSVNISMMKLRYWLFRSRIKDTTIKGLQRMVFLETMPPLSHILSIYRLVVSRIIRPKSSYGEQEHSCSCTTKHWIPINFESKDLSKFPWSLFPHPGIRYCRIFPCCKYCSTILPIANGL